MSLKGGRVRADTVVQIRQTYPPAGIPTPNVPLRDTGIKQSDDDSLTTLEFGTGSGRIDGITVSDRSIPASSSVTYDLYTGTDLTGALAEAIPFRLVRQVKVSILSGGASGVRIGGASSNEWVGWFVAAGDKADIYAGGPPFWQGDPVTGVAVGSSTKNLKIENLSSTAAVVVRVLVAGNQVVPGMWEGFGLWTYP